MNNLFKIISKNFSTLLSFAAGAGVVITAISASEATLKMHEEFPIDNPQSKTDMLKFALPYYIKPIIVGGATIAMILSAHHIDNKAKAALIAALSLSSEELKEFKIKTKEIVGDEKFEEIKKSVTKDKVEDYKKHIQSIPNGKIIIYDEYSDQEIVTSNERLLYTMLNANEKLIKNFEVSLNDVLYWLGGKRKKNVELYGWNVENEIQDYTWGYTGGPWIGLSVYMDDVNGKETLCLDYDVPPVEQIPENMIGYK